jgi:Carboxypeptidase regulatory-like domain
MKIERKKHSLVGLANPEGIDSLARAALILAATLLPVIFLWGCAGIVSGQNTKSQASPQTYSLSGAITPAIGGSGATVTLSGAASATTTADSAGNFTFTGLANGTYTVTPSHAGYTFSPTSLSVTISGANVTTGLDFTTTLQTHTISGTISPVAGGSGATVTLSGAASATTIANSSGSYTFTGLASGGYTVTPSHTGYTFSPVSQSATVNGANVTGINFTATGQVGPTYSISGTISPTAGGSGATLTLSGAVTTTTTADGAGNYTFSGLANGTYAVTPSRTGYTFSPTSQSAPVNGANVTGINFTAQVAPTFSISGTISPTAGGSGATVILSGAAAATTTTSGAGNYTFTGLTNGAYTVTPNNAGYTFSPASQNVTVNAANLTGVNFTAAVQQAHSVALGWTASTSTVSGYNVYRTTISGNQYTLVNSSLVIALAYTDTTVQSGTTYYYVTTAVDPSGNESVFSNQVPAQIP